MDSEGRLEIAALENLCWFGVRTVVGVGIEKGLLGWRLWTCGSWLGGIRFLVVFGSWDVLSTRPTYLEIVKVLFDCVVQLSGLGQILC